MGLAASQARFLGITARKSNIEYEGQQVNQQRTALAEEVNALYTKLLSLKAPIAPETTEFYETNYSFSVSNTTEYDGDYIIKNYYQNDDGTYYVSAERSGKKNTALGTVLTSSTISKTLDAQGNIVYVLNTLEGSYNLTANAQQSEYMTNLINTTYGDNTIKGSSLYYYQVDGITYYMDSEVVENASQHSSFSSYIATSKDVKETINFEKAVLTFDTNNRICGISATDPKTGDAIFNKTDVDTKRTYDQEGYETAMRDYTMSNEEYKRAVASLNARTEVLQQEDKVLELRLNQIDTEQSELQTELDAVKSVLDKNVEKTFNAFS